MRIKKALVTAVIISCVLTNFRFNIAYGKTISAKIQINDSQIEKMIEKGEYSSADKQLNEILKKNPNNINARSLQIISLAKQEKTDLAQKQLDYYLKMYPKNAQLHYAQAIVYVKRQASSDMEYRVKSTELIEEALEELTLAIKYNPKHYAAYNASGVIALNVGNYDKAKGFFYKALDINPTYSTAIDNLGTIDYLNNDIDSAEQKFKKALKYNSQNATAYFHLGQVYDKKALYSKALEYLRQSLDINPNSSVANNLMGEIYQKQDNEAAAIQSFNKSLAIKPENPKPYLNLADLYEKRADAELAIANLKTLLSANPEVYSAKLKIADMAYSNGDYKQAIKYYSSLVDNEKYKKDALKGLAASYFEQVKITTSKKELSSYNDILKAYKELEKATEANPQDLELYLAKLKLAEITNQPQKSKEALDKILSAPVTGMSSLILKGDAYLALNMYKDAKEAYTAATIFAQSTDEYLAMAEILMYEKYYDGAKTVLLKVLKLDPQNTMALTQLSYIFKHQKQSELYYKDAKYFQKTGNKVFAREYAQRSLSYNPMNFKAALLSAKLSEKNKQYETAVKDYKIVASLENKPRKIKTYNKKIKKLEKKITKEVKKFNEQ